MRIVLVAIAAVIALAGCDWAQVGFGPDQTSYNPSEPAITPTSVTNFHLDWSTQCGVCRNPALVAGGLLYFSSQSPTVSDLQTVEARDLATGTVRWSTTFNHVSDAEFIGIGNGLAYVRVGSLPLDGAQNTSDVLLAYDATTGALRWGYVPPPPQTIAAENDPVTIQNWVLDGSLVFLVTATPHGGDAASAIDATGHDVWSAAVTGNAEGIVADPGHTLFVASFVKLHPDGTGVDILTSYAEATGHVDAARFADFGPLGLVFGASPPAFANGLIYAESNANTIQGNHARAVAVRVATGVQGWSELDEWVGAVAPGAVVTLSSGGVVARNPSTGAPLWTAPGAAGGGLQPAAATDGIVFANQGGVRAFRLADGAVLGTAAAGGMITVADGHVVATPPGFGDLRVLTPTG
jgi:hypothetical protein